MVSTHTIDYIDAATTGTLSPHILPIMDFKKMLSHIEETLYHLHYIYQFHQRIQFISIDTFAHMF